MARMPNLIFQEEIMSKIGPHFLSARQVLADVVPIDTPFSIQIEASQICNIKCSYCLHSFTKQDKPALMTFNMFAILCSLLRAFDKKIKQVNFSGWGDPLVNKELPIMIRHLKYCNVTESIAIITNGLLLQPDLSQKLVSAGADHIRISLQGMTKEKYWDVCGRAINFQTLVENIKDLYEHKQGCQIYVKIADVALDEGEEELFYETFDKISDRMFVEKIRPMFHESPQDDKMLSKYGDEHAPVIACPQPFYMVAITATGDILPCCNYVNPTNMGNIFTASLTGAWSGGALQGLRLMLLDKNRKEQSAYPVCRDCLMPDAIITAGDCLDDNVDEIRKRLTGDLK
jgi:cyclic pyranopterin phosphate synthase